MVDDATVIGESTLVNGHLEGAEDLTVLGRVHGSIGLTKALLIEQSGIVKADVSVRNAVISGVVVGNITASDRVEILAEGRMVGDIVAPRVIIFEGARFRGNVDMGDLESPRASASLPARTVDRSALARKPNISSSRPIRSAPSTRVTHTPPAPPPTPAPKTVAEITRPTAPKLTKKKIKKKVVVKKKRR